MSRLNSYFDASQELRQLTHKVERLAALQRHYELFAPPSLARTSHVVQLDQQILTLAADNGAVAAKLRQLAPRLAQMLQQSGYQVTVIQVRVQVAVPPKPVATSAVALSSTGQKQLLASTEKLPDSLLKKTLQRLARKRPAKQDT